MMKKQFLVFACAVILILGAAGYALAYSGEWMFTIEGNDSNFDLNALETDIEQWFFDKKHWEREIDLTYYDKVDVNQDIGEWTAEYGFMTTTYEDDFKSGTWTTELPIEFYSVKGANEFAFYWLENLASSGTWSTEHLKNSGGTPAISHLSAWNPGDPTNPPAVPEPGTLILLGLGLVAVVGFGRKKSRA